MNSPTAPPEPTPPPLRLLERSRRRPEVLEARAGVTVSPAPRAATWMRWWDRLWRTRLQGS